MKILDAACPLIVNGLKVSGRGRVSGQQSKVMMRDFKRLIPAVAALFALSILPGQAFAQNRADCSRAASRVVAQTGGQLLSVSVAKSGNQVVCKVTVLASDQSGKRRVKKTVTVRP